MTSSWSSDPNESTTIEAFLRFLDRDLTMHPERLQGMPSELYQRLFAVTDEVPTSLDEPIEGEVAL